MADKQPDALELAEAIQYDVDIGWLIETGCDQVADKLRRQHALIAGLVGALEGLTEAVESMQNTFGFLRGEMPEDDDVCIHEKWAEEFLAERLAPSIAALAKAKEAQQ